MSDLGNLLHRFKPDSLGLAWFGNRTTNIEVYKNGIRLERKKGAEEYTWEAIDKITAGGYASPVPQAIYITIRLKGSKEKIEFNLHPDLKDTNTLLGAYSDFLLGDDFPDNLASLDIELGGLGTPMRLKNGMIVLGTREIPLNEVRSFTRGRNGFYELKVDSIKQSLPVHPDYAQNIVASIKIMEAILGQK